MSVAFLSASVCSIVGCLSLLAGRISVESAQTRGLASQYNCGSSTLQDPHSYLNRSADYLKPLTLTWCVPIAPLPTSCIRSESLQAAIPLPNVPVRCASCRVSDPVNSFRQCVHTNFVLPPLPLASTFIFDRASSCKLAGAAIGPGASQMQSRSLFCMLAGLSKHASTVVTVVPATFYALHGCYG